MNCVVNNNTIYKLLIISAWLPPDYNSHCLIVEAEIRVLLHLRLVKYNMLSHDGIILVKSSEDVRRVLAVGYRKQTQ